VWGTIWGVAGAFLAAPLTVMLMIVLAQFSSTRWIAILLSEDGAPLSHKDPTMSEKRHALHNTTSNVASEPKTPN
jgi:hypothetical protein